MGGLYNCEELIGLPVVRAPGESNRAIKLGGNFGGRERNGLAGIMGSRSGVKGSD